MLGRALRRSRRRQRHLHRCISADLPPLIHRPPFPSAHADFRVRLQVQLCTRNKRRWAFRRSRQHPLNVSLGVAAVDRNALTCTVTLRSPSLPIGIQTPNITRTEPFIGTEYSVPGAATPGG